VALPAGPAFLLLPEVEDPAIPILGEDLPHHLRPLDERAAGLGRLAPAQPEHLGERDLAPDLAGNLLDADDVAFGDAVLLPAGSDDCVHLDLAPGLKGPDG
jgi:hypothetical protein